MNKLIRMIQKRMIDRGRTDFINYAAEILGTSRQWASAKMSGKSPFKDSEIARFDSELNFDAIELKTALEGTRHDS